MYKIKTANVTVMVKDLNKSVCFYTELGLDLKQRWGDHYAQMASPGVVIGLHPGSQTGNENTNVSIGFGIEKMEDVKSRLDELGIKYEISDDKSGLILYFSDPDGTPLYFMESKVGEW